MRSYWVIGVGIIVIAIIAAGTVFYLNTRSQTGMGGARQAVFLTNGQVYFGHVQNPDKAIVRMKNIYYLKTQDLLNDSQSTDEKKKISLVKLGNELHGPTDEMLINRDQILFIESMRDDSKINDAINKFSSSPDQNSTVK